MSVRLSADEVIEIAARSLVEHDVPALRSRVLARIETASPRLRWPSLAVPAVVALATLIAVLPQRPPELPDVPRTARVPVPLADVPSVADVDRRGVPVRPAIVPAGTGAPATVEMAPSPAEAAWRAAALPPLALPAALDATVRQPEPVSIALLDIAPLAAPSVTVAPLDAARGPREP